jgi:hypothetical protein
MTGVDTNILLYAKDPRDLRKQQIAASLIPTLTDGVLFWKVRLSTLQQAGNSKRLDTVEKWRLQIWADFKICGSLFFRHGLFLTVRNICSIITKFHILTR